MMIQKSQKGFTLVEILVVISIIGILSSVVLASLNSVRMKSRDVKRKADLHQMRNALELYYSVNGRYPIIAGPWACSATANVGGCSSASWTSLATMLQPYISRLPNDPSNINVSDPALDGNLTYAYYSSASGNVYDLIALLENTTDVDRCSNKGYIDDVYSKSQGSTYYWCNPFSPTVPPPRSSQLYADH